MDLAVVYNKKVFEALKRHFKKCISIFVTLNSFEDSIESSRD